MAKFLIQDIVPPEKRHRASGEKHAGTTDLRAPARGAHPHPPIRLEKTRRVAHPEPKMHRPAEVAREFPDHDEPAHKEAATEENVGIPLDIAEEGYTSEHHEEAAPHPRMPEEPVKPTIRERIVSERSAGSWPYEKSPDPSLIGSGTYFSGGESVGGRGGLRRWIPWGGGALLAAVLVVLLLNMFESAEALIVPKSGTFSLEKELLATKDATGDDLPFSVMRVTQTEEREVPATGERTVTAKASGKIVVYNAYGTKPQRLIKNTRFESPSGKIYRINESINVPGSTTSGGKVVPGSIEVTVYADEAGAHYNSEPVDFTIPGLKGTPMYEKVYARSKGAISGGASGTVKAVSEADLAKAREDVRVALEAKLRAKARGEVSPSQIAFDGGIIIEMGEPGLSSKKASDESKAIVSAEGTLYMVVFDRALLEKAFASAAIPTYEGEPISVPNIESLIFTMQKMSGTELWSGQTVRFSLKGESKVTWVVDEDAVRDAMLGLSKDEFEATMGGFKEVAKAEAKSSPRWKSTFPKDPNDIEVTIISESQDEEN